MRAYSWIALGTVALACSGSAFTATDEATGGADGDAGEDSGGYAGVLGRAGRNSGGSLLGNGGKLGGAGNSSAGDVSSGGLISAGGDSGVGGDLVVGGSFTVAGSTSTAGTGGSGPPPIDKACPKTMPTAGGPCSDGLLCSYTADVRTACRPIAKCDGGKWAIDKPECDALHACPMLEVGMACDASTAKPCMLNATDGTYCVCTGCGIGGACNSNEVWACAAGSGGSACPKLPPNKGQMCSVDAPCGYGSCATDNGVSAVCEGGTWTWDGVLCPLAAAP